MKTSFRIVGLAFVASVNRWKKNCGRPGPLQTVLVEMGEKHE